jgi:hypothetical protein
MKTYKFKLYIKTSQNQNFIICIITRQANSEAEATKKLLKLDLPFHTHQTIEKI